MSEATAVAKNSKSKQIAALLKEKGIETRANDIVALVPGATAALVNNFKFRIRQKKEARSASRKSASRKRRGVPAPAPVVDVQGTYEQMIAVKNFAETVGGLDALAALIGKMKALAA